jgi:hypothetical protein
MPRFDLTFLAVAEQLAWIEPLLVFIINSKAK